MSTTASRQQRLRRMQLIGRVEIAREAAEDAIRLYDGDGSARASALIAAAKTRLALLNRALARMALATAI